MENTKSNKVPLRGERCGVGLWKCTHFIAIVPCHCEMYEQNRDDIFELEVERGGCTRSVDMKARKDPCLDTRHMPKEFVALVENASHSSNGGRARPNQDGGLQVGTPPLPQADATSARGTRVGFCFRFAFRQRSQPFS